MISRQDSFSVHLRDLPTMTAALEDEVIPNFDGKPQFLGVTAIKMSAGNRAEVIITSFWDDSLWDSEDEASRFVDEVVRVTGCIRSRRIFDPLYAEVRDATGTLRPSHESWTCRPHQSTPDVTVGGWGSTQ